MHTHGLDRLLRHAGTHLQSSEGLVLARQHDLRRRMIQASEDAGQLLPRLMRRERALKDLITAVDDFNGVGSEYYSAFSDVQRLLLQIQALRNLLPGDCALPPVGEYLRPDPVMVPTPPLSADRLTEVVPPATTGAPSVALPDRGAAGLAAVVDEAP